MMRLFLRLRALRDALKARANNVTTHRLSRACGVLVFTLFSLVAAQPVYAQASPLNFDSILQTMAEFAFQIAAIFTAAIVLLIDTMVPVMTYNSFTNNAVVSAGWAIVRDTVNMFFVVILIIIAFGTIFGHERFKWQQQVPRLMIMALVINFSKTLCGIMIDFGQVIMLTFANALREIAAGNIIQLFGLNQLYSLSSNSSALDGAKTASGGLGTPFDFLAAGVLSVIMVMVVLVILLGLVAVLLFRIVGLWVLVILAPMAWFAKGADGVIGNAKTFYDNWWGEFKCLVAIGPVLTFFLWLTLAVAGAGDIAVKSGFNVSADSNSADFISTGLQLKNFMSFLIGVILVFASFDAAAQVCAGSKKAGKIMGEALDPFKKVASGATAWGMTKKGAAVGMAAGGMGMKKAGAGVSLAAKGGVAAAGLAAAGAKRAPLGRWAREKRAQVTGGDELSRSEKLRKSASKHGNSAYGRWRAESKTKKADILAQSAGSNVRDEAEKLKGQTRAQKTDSAKRLADMKGIPSSIQGEAKGMASYENMIGDAQMQKDLGEDRVKSMHDKYGARYKKMAAGDAAKSGAVKNFEKANVHYSDADLSQIDTWEDAKNLSQGALRDPKVREHLKKMNSTYTTGKKKKPVSAYDALLQGHEGNKKSIAIGTNPGDHYEGMSNDHLGAVGVSELAAGASSDVMARAIETSAGQPGGAKRAKDLISQMAVRYQDKNTTDAERVKILDHMDNLGPKLSRSDGIIKGVAGDTKAGTHLSRVRSAVLASRTAPIKEFNAGQDGKQYAKSMGNADTTRKRTHVDALRNKSSEQQGELGELQSNLDEIRDDLAPERQGMVMKTQASAHNLEASKQKVQNELQKKVEDLSKAFHASRAKHASLEGNPDTKPDQLNTAKEEMDALWVQFGSAIKKAKVGSTENTEAVSQHDDVQKANLDFTKASEELSDLDMTIGDFDEVKQLSKQIASKTEHVKQISEAIEALNKTIPEGLRS